MNHFVCLLYKVIFAMSNLTDVSRDSSEQHIEISDARKSRDMKDFITLLQFLEDHNSFDSKCIELWNIFSGLVDSQHKVTAVQIKLS